MFKLTEKKETKKLKITISKLHLFQALTIIFAVAMVASFALRPTGCFVAGNAEEVGEQTLGFINTYMLPPEYQATIASSSSESGMYVFQLDIMGEQQPVYVSGDGKWLMPTAIDMTEDMSALEQDTENEPVEIDMAAISEIVNSVEEDSEKVQVYFFYGEGCPHCAKEDAFLETMLDKYPELEVKKFETYNTPENWYFYQAMAAAYNISANGVPGMFVGEQSWVGFSDDLGVEMENFIADCIENGCPSPLLKLK